MKLFKSITLILFIFVFSCTSEKQIVFNEEKISDPKKLYIDAFNLYQTGKYNEALDLFEKIELNFFRKSSYIFTNRNTFNNNWHISVTNTTNFRTLSVENTLA